MKENDAYMVVNLLKFCFQYLVVYNKFNCVTYDILSLGIYSNLKMSTSTTGKCALNQLHMLACLLMSSLFLES